MMATEYRAHKIRLYPTKAQEILLRKTAGCARYAYNWALAAWERMYADYVAGKSADKPTAIHLSRQWTKEREPWTKEVHRGAQTKAILNVGVAFDNYWKGICKRPTFHKKYKHNSFYVDNEHAYIQEDRISLPRIGKVKLAEELRYQGDVVAYTVSNKLGVWYVSVRMVVENPCVCNNPRSIVGIDVGLHTPATASDGMCLNTPKRLTGLYVRLKQAQRSVARKVKGSNNRSKALQRQRCIQQKINNIRSDAVHKFTTTITKNHGIVVTETLDATALQQSDSVIKRRCMATSMMKEIIRQIAYKAQHHIMVDRFYPSTKTCSCCGHVRDNITLDERTYVCPNCGLTIDRDMNAALNLMTYAGRVTPGEPVDSLDIRRAEAGSTTPF